MNALGRWLAKPAFTIGGALAVIAAVAAANGIQALTSISNGATLLVVVGFIITGRAAWEIGRHVFRRKAEP